MKTMEILRHIVVALLGGILGLVTIWAVAALYFDGRISWLPIPVAVICGLGIRGSTRPGGREKLSW
jgi:hypothetical protein